MGGSSDQVVGYKYYCGLMVVIGNTIERLVNINPDNRGWILQSSVADEAVFINKPDLFGGDKQEGGWVGYIDVHTGKPATLEQNHYLAQHDSEIVSAFPNLSYLVYHGLTDDRGFNVVSMSGMMKEVLYCVRRIGIKNNGTQQWNYDKAEIVNVIPDTASEPNLRFEGLATSRSYLDSEQQDSEQTTLSWSFGGGNPNFNNYIAPISAEYQQYPPYNVPFPKSTGSVEFTASINSQGKVKVTGRFIVKAQSFAIIASAGVIIDSIKTWKSDGQEQEGVSDYEYEAWFDLTNDSTFGIRVNFSGNYETTFSKELRGALIWNYFYGPYPTEAAKEPTGDINPIHKIREILTDDTAMNKPESDVNDVNFLAAADRIYQEELGISWAIQEKTCKEAIDELLYHIEAGIRVNRQTGKYEVILFRDDLLGLDDAMSFSESNIKNLSREVANQDDMINVLNVKYYDRESIKESAFSVYDNGSIMSNGNQEIAESVNFPYFMVRKNAELVSNWKLKQLSTPTWKGSFATGKYEARRLNKYDVIKLSWLNAGFVDMPVRVMKISLGDGVDNTVSIDWVEVVPYSSSSFQSVNVDPPTNVVLPAQMNYSKVFEMPYFEAVQNFGQTQTDAELANNPDLGYLMIASKKPQNNSLNASLYTDAGAGYRQQNTINYCPTLVLDEDIDYLDTSFAVKNIDSIGAATVGSCIVLRDEIMVYQSYNPTTKVLTVKRGALDTVPQKHLSDNTFFFYDAYPSFDTTQYVDGETVNAKSLTTTPSSVLNIADAPELPLEINARAIRPYPPANIKINGQYYLDEIASDLILTWVDRNRTQQTGGDILGWTESTVTIESGTQTWITIKELDADDVVLATHNINATGLNTYTFASSIAQANTKFLDLTLKTVRDGYDSYQQFNHKIKFSAFFSAPYNITYAVREV
ncbi:MAG: phage tail protein [Acinetobacter sp.]